MVQRLRSNKTAAIVAGILIAATLAAVGWIWAVQSSSASRSETVTDGIPTGILFETPTVPVSGPWQIELSGQGAEGQPLVAIDRWLDKMDVFDSGGGGQSIAIRDIGIPDAVYSARSGLLLVSGFEEPALSVDGKLVAFDWAAGGAIALERTLPNLMGYKGYFPLLAASESGGFAYYNGVEFDLGSPSCTATNYDPFVCDQIFVGLVPLDVSSASIPPRRFDMPAGCGPVYLASTPILPDAIIATCSGVQAMAVIDPAQEDAIQIPFASGDTGRSLPVGGFLMQSGRLGVVLRDGTVLLADDASLVDVAFSRGLELDATVASWSDVELQGNLLFVPLRTPSGAPLITRIAVISVEGSGAKLLDTIPVRWQNVVGAEGGLLYGFSEQSSLETIDAATGAKSAGLRSFAPETFRVIW